MRVIGADRRSKCLVAMERSDSQPADLPRPAFGSGHGHHCSPLCQLEGVDRPVPFDLAGVPQLTSRLAGQAITRGQSACFKRIINRAVAELRRRYEQHNEQTLAALVAREAEEDAGEF